MSEFVSEVGVLLQACVQELKHVGPNNALISLTWVFLVKVEVFSHQLIQIVGLRGVEKCWVLEDALTRHHSVAAGKFKSLFNIFKG